MDPFNPPPAVVVFCHEQGKICLNMLICYHNLELPTHTELRQFPVWLLANGYTIALINPLSWLAELKDHGLTASGQTA